MNIHRSCQRRACLRDGCALTETEYHTGGEATTAAQAICGICLSLYGGLVPDIISPTESSTVTVYEGERATTHITAKNAASYRWMMSTDGGNSWNECGGDIPSLTTAPVTLKDSGLRCLCVVTGSGAAAGQSGIGNPPDGAPTALSPVFALEVLQREALPQTGDDSRPGLWLALGLISAAALAVFCLRGRKNGRA